MKKIITRVLLVLAVLVGIYIVARPKIHEITRAKDIKNFLNEKGRANISKNTIKRYKYKNEKDVEYDISPLMANYVNTVYNVVKNKEINRNYYVDYIFTINEKDGTLIQSGFDNTDCEVLTREVTKEMLSDYNEGVFLDNFAKKIDEAIQGYVEHRSDWILGDYYIKADKNFEINLPYNVRMSFTSKTLDILPKKECTNVSIKYNPNYKQEFEAKIDYIENGEKKNTTMYIEFNDTGWNKDNMTINIYGWFYDIKDPNIYIATKNRDEVIVTHPEYNENEEEDYSLRTTRNKGAVSYYTNDDVEVNERYEYEMDKNGRNGIWFMNDDGEYELKYVDEDGNIIEESKEETEAESEEETETEEETQETKKKSLVDQIKEREGK